MVPRVAVPLVALGLLFVAIAVPGGGAASSSPDPEAQAAAVRLSSIGRFDQPVHVAAPPGDRNRVFVVEQPGRIRIVQGGRKLSRPFLDIRGKVGCCGERGLLSMAFAPDYGRSRRFYVFYTANNGDLRVVEYRAQRGKRNRAARGSARGLLRVNHRREANHNGGQLAFGPDRRLYISTGDGGGGGDPFRNGQNRRSKLGKILVMNPRRRGARAGVYSYGLRNPYRFSFDRSTGDLTIGDVGQSAIEEINFKPRGQGRGANFGWSVFEGTRRFRAGSAPGHDPPVIQHSQDDGWCAIIGGFVVRDRANDLFGRYVYGDNCKSGLYSARLAAGGGSDVRRVGVSVSGLSSFGEDGRGRVYATSLNGPVYRLR
jgi:glucose/arabinose dehydrogenase